MRALPAHLRHLFFLCFLVYSAAYVGRYNYSSAIPAMAEAGFDRQVLGVYGTGFLFCYGAGQLLSGFLGDKVPARRLIAVGLVGSGLANLLMGFLPPGWQWIWCVNGLFQSMLWSPITRLLADWLPENARKGAMIQLSYSFAVGALAAYGLSALLLRDARAQRHAAMTRVPQLPRHAIDRLLAVAEDDGRCLVVANDLRVVEKAEPPSPASQASAPP